MNNSHKSPWILDTSDEQFDEDVLRRSAEIPVVVDFWADWCQPCRLLAPVLEQLADEFQGKFILAKANTEQTPVAAASFRVQSIPAVYAVRDGRVVDGFLGALPADEVRQWLTRSLPTPAEELLITARRLRDSDPVAFAAHLAAAVATDPGFSPAQIELAHHYLDQQDVPRAHAILQQLEQRGFLEPEAERLRAAIERSEKSTQAGSVDECRQHLISCPNDPLLQLQLADALVGAGQYAESLALCLEVVRHDHGAPRERARQTMVDIFRLLPDESELTHSYRRQLSMALY